MKVLLIGYGNVDRQDDGVAYHVLAGIMQKLDIPIPPDNDLEEMGSTDTLVFRFQMQLTPELSEDLIQYDHACFIDAHTGNVPEDVHFEELKAQYQRSPFTHHLTAQTLLSMTETIHQKAPQSILISVRGKDFGFSRTLSTFTSNLVPSSVDIVINWLRQINAIE